MGIYDWQLVFIGIVMTMIIVIVMMIKVPERQNKIVEEKNK